MAKTKGANAEREVAAILKPIVDKVYRDLGIEPPVIKRNLEQTRSGGYDLVGIDWMALEVKRQENLSIPAWWRQTLRQAKPDQLPVLIYRQNRKPWKVIMMGGIRVASGKWLKVRVDVSLQDFLRYFKARLKHDLSK